jgi:hypothetical protein
LKLRPKRELIMKEKKNQIHGLKAEHFFEFINSLGEIKKMQ